MGKGPISDSSQHFSLKVTSSARHEFFLTEILYNLSVLKFTISVGLNRNILQNKAKQTTPHTTLSADGNSS